MSKYSEGSLLKLCVIPPTAFEPYYLLGHRFIHLDPLTITHGEKKQIGFTTLTKNPDEKTEAAFPTIRHLLS